MIGIVFGGLLATAVFLYPALQLKRRHKWPIVMGMLMLLAGLGLVGISFWVAGLLGGIVGIVVGGIALVMLAGFGIAIIADLSDKKLDYPWFVFILPSLIAVVLLTGTRTLGYVGDQMETNVNKISSQVGT